MRDTRCTGSWSGRWRPPHLWSTVGQPYSLRSHTLIVSNRYGTIYGGLTVQLWSASWYTCPWLGDTVSIDKAFLALIMVDKMWYGSTSPGNLGQCHLDDGKHRWNLSGLLLMYLWVLSRAQFHLNCSLLSNQWWYNYHDRLHTCWKRANALHSRNESFHYCIQTQISSSRWSNTQPVWKPTHQCMIHLNEDIPWLIHRYKECEGLEVGHLW